MKNEDIKIKGFYRIRLVDKNGKVVKYEHHNFVNNTLKKIALAESMSKMFKMNIGNPFGMVVCTDNGVFTGKGSSATNYLNFNSLKGGDAVVLLNLPDELEMNSSTKYLNILSADGSGIDNSKITGYSVGRLSSGSDKEGVIENITSADMMSNQYQVVNTFMFDIDKAIGEFNWIAVMPSFEYTPYRGLMAWKCISNYNIRNVASKFNSGYIGPDVKDTKGNVLTGPSQILTFESDGTNARWFYDLKTGEKKAVQPTDFAYSWTNDAIVSANNVGHMIAVGDHLYVVSGGNLLKIEIATGATISQVAVASNTQRVENNPIGMYYDGTNIICSCYSVTTSETNAYVSTVTRDMKATKTYNNAYDGWGNLPQTWDKRRCCFTKVGDYYLVQYVRTEEYADMNYTGAIIVCTDLKDVCGTIVGVMPSNGFNAYSIDDAIYCLNTFTASTNASVGLKLTDGVDTATKFTYDGVYISTFDFTNFWSASKLDKLYTKTNEVKAIIDYGYAFSLN